ncbi:MAG: VWA domain-containing protein [Acidimicrobiia bacterium]
MTTRAALPLRTIHRRRRRLVPALGVVLTIGALAGCSSPGPAPGGGTAAPTTSAAGSAGAHIEPVDGWVGGRPDFDDDRTLDGAVGRSEAEAAGGADAAVFESGPAAPATTIVAGTVASPDPAGAPLRAGSVDDNEDYAGFLSYLDRLESAGIAARPWDPRGRIVVQVLDGSGRPVPGAVVDVRADPQGGSVRLRATADGTVRFLPAVYGATEASYTFESVGGSVSGAPGSELELVAAAPAARPDRLAVDVLFLLDATGSMGDEIGQLTANIATIAENVAVMAPDAELRFGMTLYRDDVDTFTTATYRFTSDLDAFGRALAEVTAAGGGDQPEALDEGLAEAMAEPGWGPPEETLQLIFVVGDAAPQVGRRVPVPYTDSLTDALERGIKVFPIASSGTDDVAELVFRQLAQATGGRFVFLAYGAAGAALGAGTDIATTDYEELSLDQLVTRLIAEELSDWTGRTVSAPVQVSTSTTRPPGQ